MIRRPTQSELEGIETSLRLFYMVKGVTPKLVRLAGDEPNRRNSAWKNEAIRYFYLCVRRGLDPISADPSRVIVPERDE